MKRQLSKHHNPMLTLVALLTASALYPATAEAAPTKINACGTIITQPGPYKVTENLLHVPDASPGGFACIIIRAGAVKLDLGGYSIVGTATVTGPMNKATVGVDASDPTTAYVTVRNGTVRNFGTGVRLNNGGDARNLRVVNNVDGLEMNKGSIASQNIFDSNSGLAILVSNGGRVSGNVFRNNGDLATGAGGAVSIECPSLVSNNIVTGPAGPGPLGQGCLDVDNVIAPFVPMAP